MPPKRRVVLQSPENSETPIGDLRSWVTPNRLFFVRNHFDAPEIDLSTWSLRVAGLVNRELELNWDQIQALPQHTVFATLECAGNGRSFLETPVHGVQWGAGAVGHAEWTGVPLRLLLEQADLKPEALEIVFSGADRGSEPDHPQTMSFARSLAVDKAMHGDTLLATHMNGEPLDLIHGSPLRLIVPGWYGVASVKWLTRIQVTDKRFHGYYQSVKYTVERQTGTGLVNEVVGEMQPKSEILLPRDGDTLGIAMTRVLGVAWSGPDSVAAVEISVDGGKNWTQADLVGPNAAYSWTLWEYAWRPVEMGPHELLARAVSNSGKVQPMRHDPLNRGYLVNFCRPVRVLVTPSWESADGIDDPSLAARTVREVAEQRSKMPLDVDMKFKGGSGI